MSKLIVTSINGTDESFEFSDGCSVEVECGALICVKNGNKAVVYATGRWDHYVFEEDSDE